MEVIKHIFQESPFLMIILIIAIWIGFCVLSSRFADKKKKTNENKNNNYNTNNKNNNNITYDYKKMPRKDLKEKNSYLYGYYRYQDDIQDVIKRSAEQQKLFEEYFVVPNLRTVTCKPEYRIASDVLNIVKIFALILGVFFAVIAIVSDTIWLALGLFLFVSGIACHFIGKYFAKQFDLSIKITDAPRKLMTDEEYEKIVKEKIESMDMISLGLKRLGLDGSQIEEIKPIVLTDKAMTDTSLRVYNKTDGTLHSSTQCVTLLYFTDSQMFVYKIQFDMCCNEQKEWMSEFFYEDICDISTHVEKSVLTVSEEQKIEYSTVEFEIIASNSSIGFVLQGDDANIGSIQGMKQKIRDKRNT